MVHNILSWVRARVKLGCAQSLSNLCSMLCSYHALPRGGCIPAAANLPHTAGRVWGTAVLKLPWGQRAVGSAHDSRADGLRRLLGESGAALVVRRTIRRAQDPGLAGSGESGQRCTVCRGGRPYLHTLLRICSMSALRASASGGARVLAGTVSAEAC